MILIELEVPSLGRNYQFYLNKDTVVKELILEIADMICQREQCRCLSDASDMELGSKNLGTILSKDMSLASQGIVEADRLILV